VSTLQDVADQTRYLTFYLPGEQNAIGSDLTHIRSRNTASCHPETRTPSEIRTHGRPLTSPQQSGNLRSCVHLTEVVAPQSCWSANCFCCFDAEAPRDSHSR
jgi:hypothetical protein